MKKADKRRCGFCGRELEGTYKHIILRDVEERGKTRQLFTVAEADMCSGCAERFEDFRMRCQLDAEI